MATSTEGTGSLTTGRVTQQRENGRIAMGHSAAGSHVKDPRGNWALQTRPVLWKSKGDDAPFSVPLGVASRVTGWAFLLLQKHPAWAELETGRNLFQVPFGSSQVSRNH